MNFSFPSKVTIVLMAASLTFAWLNAGCAQSTITQPEQVGFPDSAVSFRASTQPFLTLACGQCHGEANAAGGIRLTQYNYLLFDRPNLVVAEKPDESLLVQILDGDLMHPVGGLDRVNLNQRIGIRVWVKEGAKNN